MQQVLCNGSLSKMKLIKFGVPQGSILGPFLFLLFINDLPNASPILRFVLFADDTNIFASHKSYDILFQTMNQELKHVVDWFRVNKLSLNLNKTNYVLFCSHRKPIPEVKGTVFMDNKPLPQVTSVKFLGVYVDQFLTWKVHIENISKKVAKSVGILARTAHLLPTRIRLSLYYSLVHPYLSYCNVVWASNYPSRLVRLTSLQKRAARIILGNLNSLSSQAMLQKLNICNIEQIRIKQTSEFMFKYMHNLLPGAFTDFFSLTSQSNPYNVRTSSNYRGIATRTNTRKFSIKSAGPRTWNNLPVAIRVSPSISIFKKKLRHHLLTVDP